MKRLIISAVLSGLMHGCAPTPYWTLTDNMNHVAQSKSFEVRIPEGWMRTTKADTWERIKIDDNERTIQLESMTTSRDGTSLQAISVTRRYADTAFPTIKKKCNPSMLPLELADLYVSELRKRNELERLTVLSNQPATIAGKPGFNLVMEFKNDDGLRIRVQSYGFVDQTGFYTINYRAPYLYYFNRDHGGFQTVVRSFKQLKGANDPPPAAPRWAKSFM